jgi:unsaturated chondroitin disaccharide hydrolase
MGFEAQRTTVQCWYGVSGPSAVVYTCSILCPKPIIVYMFPAGLSAPPILDQIDLERAFELCSEKALRNIPLIAESERTWGHAQDGDYENRDEGFFHIDNWTTGFFTGMGVLAWMRSGDSSFLRAVEGMDSLYQRKVTERAADTMHDLGFLYSPYAVALYQLTGGERHKELGLKAAELLATRFIKEGNYIRAWGRMDDARPEHDHYGLAIIDCMMNLPLLYWANEVTGDSKFKDIAIRHSDMTLKHFIRPDASVYHSFRFNPDGTPRHAANHCGHHVESHWARGAAWAMYGFALGYRHTGTKAYLEVSLRLTRKWISLLDEEGIPVWDFDLRNETEPLRDSSAAAIAVCAIQELDALGHGDAQLRGAKVALLSRLCSVDYLDECPGTRGILRKGQVGNQFGPCYAYTSWGDYFLMEALGRELGLEISWW